MQSAGKFGLATGWSHDIRTHLNLLLGAVSMIDSGKLTQEQFTQYITIVKQNIHAMLRLVNLLLDADVPCQTEAPHLANVQVDGLLRTVIETTMPYALERQLEIVYDIAAPLHSFCDAAMLERVLYNLLTNAIKCTEPKGFVYLSAKSTESWVEIHIADTGCGLTEQQLDHLCCDISQPTRLGTGLQLVKMLMASMNGQIACTSRKNVGTTFYLKLPLAQYDKSLQIPCKAQHETWGALA